MPNVNAVIVSNPSVSALAQNISTNTVSITANRVNVNRDSPVNDSASVTEFAREILSEGLDRVEARLAINRVV